MLNGVVNFFIRKQIPDKKLCNVTNAYKDVCCQVQDVCFLNNGTHFISCADLVNRDSADRNIIVWDFGSGAVLSNQIFHVCFMKEFTIMVIRNFSQIQ
jgi:hypothetical protein